MNALERAEEYRRHRWEDEESRADATATIVRLEDENATLREQVRVLREACEYIATLGGNLPDDRHTSRTGPNDAVHRGLMYVEARRAARAAIEATATDDTWNLTLAGQQSAWNSYARLAARIGCDPLRMAEADVLGLLWGVFVSENRWIREEDHDVARRAVLAAIAECRQTESQP